MEQQHVPGQQSAREAIEYVCRLLRSYGVDCLTPERVRQAKFNSPVAYQPLLQALHDLSLCVAAGLPHGCGDSMRMLKQQLHQESVDESTLPAEGAMLLVQLLAQWGCPAGLVAQLALLCTSSQRRDNNASCSTGQLCSSRLCLLCLAWLVGHAQLFDRALQHLQIPPALLQLLPPYPEDTSRTAAAQARYHAAASAARQHADKVQSLLQSQCATADGSCWQQVQTAAHHLLSTYRSASLRLQLLSSLLEGKEKLLHEIRTLQLERQHAQHEGRKTGSGSRVTDVPVLTAFELHLMLNPQLLQQHQEALQQACSLLGQQLQCIRAAQTFFAWASSVLDVEEKQEGTSVLEPADTVMPTSRTAEGAHRGPGRNVQARQQECQQLPLPQPTVAEVLPLVQQLPAADSPAAGQILLRIVKQLQQAAARPVGSVNSCAADGSNLPMSALSLNNTTDQLASPAAIAAEAVAAFNKAAVAAMVASGLAPLPEQGLLTLPEDIQKQLDTNAQQLHYRQVKSQQQLSEQHEQVWHRQQVDGEQLARLVKQQQGQSQQQPILEGLGVEITEPPGPVGNSTVQQVPISCELQRLHVLALNVAKQLARIRATNKQQLQVASNLLLAAGDDSAARSHNEHAAPKLGIYNK